MSRAAFLSLGLLSVVAACTDVPAPAPIQVAALQAGETPVVIDGTIYWNQLEGGFYAIRGRDGRIYDPTNLPAEYQRDILPVTATVVVTGGASIHMVGTMVKILRIQPIGNPFAF